MLSQTRFALSSVESWSSEDGEFDYEAFFNNIVDLFETDNTHPWVLETLEWWQRYALITSHSHVLLTFRLAAKSLALAIAQRNGNVPQNRIRIAVIQMTPSTRSLYNARRLTDSMSRRQVGVRKGKQQARTLRLWLVRLNGNMFTRRPRRLRHLQPQPQPPIPQTHPFPQPQPQPPSCRAELSLEERSLGDAQHVVNSHGLRVSPFGSCLPSRHLRVSSLYAVLCSHLADSSLVCWVSHFGSWPLRLNSQAYVPRFANLGLREFGSCTALTCQSSRLSAFILSACLLTSHLVCLPLCSHVYLRSTPVLIVAVLDTQ
jgi:hypothetical protein